MILPTLLCNDGLAASLEDCLLRELREANGETTVNELRARCEHTGGQQDTRDSLLLRRLASERSARDNRFALIPHNRNYLLPATYANDPNDEPFQTQFGDALPEEQLDHVEAKFQLSFKSMVANDLLLERDGLYFAFTSLSFWQAYNSAVSAPFRETNYEPEVFWAAPLDWRPFDVDASLVTLGFSHQSNGRGGSLSRSWNRVYANFIVEKNHLVLGLKPWWRIPESDKEGPFDPSGDDNPDIEDFLGNFEFTAAYRRGNQEWSLMLRNNLKSDNHGAIQIEWTFPLWRGVRGFAQYFNGYGESLIDYDAHIERIGVGILLSDLL